MSKSLCNSYFQSPIGLVEISGTSSFITSVNFVTKKGRESENISAVVKQCKIEFEEYFSGKRKEFSVNINPEGTPFQKKVWSQLRKIIYGDTISYLNISKMIGDEKAVRAVGHANGKNQIAIIIPCHRVVGADGKLTGYAGGIWRKQWLLDLDINISKTNLTLF